MRIVTWTDAGGYTRRALLRDGDPDEDAARIGVPLGPPSLEDIDAPADLLRELHNMLMARNLLNWADALVQQGGLTACARLVGRKHGLEPRQVSELRRRLIAVYKINRR